MHQGPGADAPSHPVTVSKSGAITTVVLSRPHARNAVDGPTARALSDAFLAFEADETQSVGVLTGADGAFCAGADLKAAAEGGARANRIEPAAFAHGFDRLAPNGPMGPTRMILSKPVIAAIAGPAVAGGMELALWCDMRVMEEDAVLGVYCRRWGVPLIDGGTMRLPRLIGHSRAMDLILTGRPVHADEALAMGLVNRVVPKGEARAAAEALAAEIARFPQGCLRSDRMSAYEQWDLPYASAMANEVQRGLTVVRSGETQAGAQRFASGKGRGGSFEDL